METQSKCIYCKSVLTFKEAAEYTGFSEGYLHQLTANQVIPFSKPNGKTIFFSRERLEEWMLGNPTEPKNAKNPRACACDILNNIDNNINNTDIEEKENKEIEKKKKEKESSRFVAPQLNEVIAYFCDNLKSDKATAESFYDYYESKGWMVGVNKMKKWHNAASGWVRRQSEYTPKRNYSKGPDVSISNHFDPEGDAFTM